MELASIVQPFTDFWHYGFMQRALVAGIVVGVSCSLLSVFITLRRMAFIGQGISHSAFGGVGLSLWLFEGQEELTLGLYLITTIYCLLVGLAIGLVARRKRIAEDSVIGIFLAVSMALGIIFISLRRSYTPEIMSYLFGDILSILPGEIYGLIGISIVVITAVFLFYKELFLFTYDEELARAEGVPTETLRFMLLGLLALTIVLALKAIGIVLLTAYLIIPGATAQLVCRSFNSMVWVAIVVGVSSTLVGLWGADVFNMPSGATIVVVQFLVFLAFRLRGR